MYTICRGLSAQYQFRFFVVSNGRHPIRRIGSPIGQARLSPGHPWRLKTGTLAGPLPAITCSE